MGFLNPVNLFYAVSIAVLVAIYLRSRSRPTVEVSSLMLFEQAPAPVARIRTLRTDLLFWLEVAALSALVLAMAGLYVRSAPSPLTGRSRALIFDLGAAMGARQGAQTRLDLAKQQAVAIVSSAPEHDDFVVLGYGLDARTVRPASNDRGALIDAIRRLNPTAVASAADALAAALMRVQTASEIDVFTDRPLLPAMPAESGIASRLHVHQVGAPLGNLAIVSLATGTPRNSPGRVVVKNFFPVSHECELSVECAGKTVLARTLLLGPGEQSAVNFGPLASGGLVHARILTSDPLAADNDRYAFAPLGAPDPVLVLSPDRQVRDDLARVLLAVNNDFIVTGVAPAKFRPSVEGAKRFRLAVMHDCFVRGVKADSLLLVYPPAMTPVASGPLAGFAVGSALKRVWMLEDASDQESLELGPARIASLPDWMTRTASGEASGAQPTFALAALGMIPQGRFGFIGFDVRDHLLVNPDKLRALVVAVDMVRELTAPGDIRIVPTGAYLSVPVERSAKVIDPVGAVFTLKADRWGRVRLRPMIAGRYRVESAGATVNIYANYYDASESNLAAVAQANDPKAASAPAPEPRGAARRVRPLGMLLVVLALVALIVESVLLVGRSRRWRAWNV